MCDGCGQNFSIVRRRQVATGRKRRTEGNAMAAQRAARVGIGTQYKARYAGGAEPLSGGDDSVRPPPARIPHSSLQSFPFGPATLWGRVQSRGAMGAGETFQPSPAGRDRRSAKRRSEGNAMAARRGGDRYAVQRSTLAMLAEQNRCQVGPTILFDRPRQEPPPLTSSVPNVGPAMVRSEGGVDVRRVGGGAFQISVPG
jgi:hypothetical protein